MGGIWVCDGTNYESNHVGACNDLKMNQNSVCDNGGIHGSKGSFEINLPGILHAAAPVRADILITSPWYTQSNYLVIFLAKKQIP